MKKTAAILILFSLVASSCHSPSDPPGKDETTRVMVVPAKIREDRTIVCASGQLSSKTEVKLSFKSGGVIEEILVTEGQQVRKGTLLARLNLAEVRAMVKQAEEGYLKAERDFQRVENLYLDSVATLENLQDAGTGLKIAMSNLEIARFNRKYSEIEAPTGGKVLKKLAEADEIVGPGQPVFLFGTADDDWVVKVGITDRDIIRIASGDSGSVRFDPYPNTAFQAIVTEVGSLADPYTGTYEVELRVLPGSRRLVSGFIAQVEIVTGTGLPCLQIPVDALVYASADSAFVFVVRDGTAFRRPVCIAGIAGHVCILEGLAEGEAVVTEGAQYLADGDRVVVVQKPL